MSSVCSCNGISIGNSDYKIFTCLHCERNLYKKDEINSVEVLTKKVSELFAIVSLQDVKIKTLQDSIEKTNIKDDDASIKRNLISEMKDSSPVNTAYSDYNKDSLTSEEKELIFQDICQKDFNYFNIGGVVDIYKLKALCSHYDNARCLYEEMEWCLPIWYQTKYLKTPIKNPNNSK